MWNVVIGIDVVGRLDADVLTARCISKRVCSGRTENNKLSDK